MKTVTYEEFIKFDPCWLGNEDKMSQLKGYFETIPNMNALDMLWLDEVSIDDKFWAVLREDLIPANTLHEFACLCAEHALAKLDNPDPRSVEAIIAKRKWMRGEITNAELQRVREAANWVAMKTARDVAMETARDAAMETARDVAMETARDVAMETARDATWDEEREWQLDTLVKLLQEEQTNE